MSWIVSGMFFHRMFVVFIGSLRQAFGSAANGFLSRGADLDVTQLQILVKLRDLSVADLVPQQDGHESYTLKTNMSPKRGTISSSSHH